MLFRTGIILCAAILALSATCEGASRVRRESDDGEDVMAKLNKAFSSIKEDFQAAAGKLAQTDLFKDTQAKLAEFGQSFSEAGKQIGANMQQKFQELSKSQS
uniref:Venom peptide Ld11a n=1 Tax=Lethocerus distinctifemur TaxID=280095 RepID=A0A2K8JVX0_9HEMI|nr:venom peptide Ld11a [Lethocerus distinctifemur]